MQDGLPLTRRVKRWALDTGFGTLFGAVALGPIEVLRSGFWQAIRIRSQMAINSALGASNGYSFWREGWMRNFSVDSTVSENVAALHEIGANITYFAPIYVASQYFQRVFDPSITPEGIADQTLIAIGVMAATYRLYKKTRDALFSATGEPPTIPCEQTSVVSDVLCYPLENLYAGWRRGTHSSNSSSA